MFGKLASRILLAGVRSLPKEVTPVVSVKLEAASRLRRGYSDNPVYNTIPQVSPELGLAVTILIVLSVGLRQDKARGQR